MKEQLYKEFKEDLKQFEKVTAGFYKGEVTTAEYKGISGGFGSYAQRGGKNSMLRLRLAGGRINKDQLKFIVDAVEEFQIDKIHFTTCQTIQLHNLNEEAVCRIMEQAFEVGIITRGGGGDFPRNVMVSPLSGVEEGEAFDVLPYAKQAADYLLSLIKTVKLPRKLKVAFSNSKDNLVHATFRDLGFVATKNHTFDVYSAGGLGNNYKMGVLVAQDVKPEKVLYYIKAMVDTFTEYGNYQQRSKARTRYMQESLGGPEQYKKAYEEKLQKVLETENLDILAEEKDITKTGKEDTIPETKTARVIRQKQTGLCAVHYHPIGGCIAPKTLAGIVSDSKGHGTSGAGPFSGRKRIYPEPERKRSRNYSGYYERQCQNKAGILHCMYRQHHLPGRVTGFPGAFKGNRKGGKKRRACRRSPSKTAYIRLRIFLRHPSGRKHGIPRFCKTSG